MESLLYVVLYCGFLWLPHNLSKEDLAYTIKALFDSSYWDQGNIQGGRGKLANALRRQYTADVEFNEHLKVWMDTIMDYNYPTLESNYCGPSRWSSPDDLEEFWSKFLQTHDLPCNDRTVHDHPHATDMYESPEGSEGSTSTEAITLGKHGLEEDHCDEVPVVEIPREVHMSHYSSSDAAEEYGNNPKWRLLLCSAVLPPNILRNSTRGRNPRPRVKPLVVEHAADPFTQSP